jgi:hypothetical protein
MSDTYGEYLLENSFAITLIPPLLPTATTQLSVPKSIPITGMSCYIDDRLCCCVINLFFVEVSMKFYSVLAHTIPGNIPSVTCVLKITSLFIPRCETCQSIPTLQILIIFYLL